VKTTIRMRGAAGAIAGSLLALSAAAQDGRTPVEVVESLHSTLIQVMKNARELGYDGRHEEIEPVLKRNFDIPFMAEKSVGRHWRELDEGQREQLVTTFGEFTAANYAGRFDGYSGQHFETLGQEPAMHETMLVRTRLLDPDGEFTQLDYRLRKREGSWRIIDVYLNGTVSELALRRSEYSSLIRREGYDALIAALHDKIEELSSAATDGKITPTAAP